MATKPKPSSSSAGSGILAKLTTLVLPSRANKKGVAIPGHYNPSDPNQVLTVPGYREHLTDLFTTRQASNSRELLKQLFIQDPDVSGAVNAYLTMANTEMLAIVKDVDGAIDRDGQKILNAIMSAYEQRSDYSKGFQLRPSIREICENLRWLLLRCGTLPVEMVLDENFSITEFRMVDPDTLEWVEPQPGVFKPQQKTSDGKTIVLDIPTFFVKFHRREPTSMYTYSSFVSAINTIAARQQVINDLYRIMKLTGYPRMEVTVMEEVLRKKAPAELHTDAAKMDEYIRAQLQTISSAVAGIRPDQAFIHTDSIETGMLNEKSAGMTLDISKVIETLNAQNQAGLRTMATILGRGNSGVNTATVEARLFTMNAEELNNPVADLFASALTLAIRLQGSASTVEVSFRPSEMRPDTELEPQYTMRAARLKEDLSLGIISDDEYHLQMYGRLRPDSAPELSGTGFMNQGKGVSSQIDPSGVSPNQDPMGRSLTPDGSKSARSNTVKSGKA
ncbi:hypothetical protein PJWF_00008 [Achromobacter phage JWF]|uniref:portal protein n=1 Tax=Achromobacter phage JWF TaxID=1589748 RepID=UPI000588E30C|nr:portal protein [Achromobacter phage JWF]AJD82902.1 hypothetical protein PJWF_00008 [Achromobacter phage JWF]